MKVNLSLMPTLCLPCGMGARVFGSVAVLSEPHTCVEQRATKGVNRESCNDGSCNLHSIFLGISLCIQADINHTVCYLKFPGQDIKISSKS